MGSDQSGRRKFLKNGTALAGLALSAMRSTNAWSLEPEAADLRPPAAPAVHPKDYNNYGERSRFETAVRESDYPTRPFPAKKLSPIQDSVGIITPAPLH